MLQRRVARRRRSLCIHFLGACCSSWVRRGCCCCGSVALRCRNRRRVQGHRRREDDGRSVVRACREQHARLLLCVVMHGRSCCCGARQKRFRSLLLKRLLFFRSRNLGSQVLLHFASPLLGLQFALRLECQGPRSIHRSLARLEFEDLEARSFPPLLLRFTTTVLEQPSVLLSFGSGRFSLLLLRRLLLFESSQLDLLSCSPLALTAGLGFQLCATSLSLSEDLLGRGSRTGGGSQSGGGGLQEMSSGRHRSDSSRKGGGGCSSNSRSSS